jgi:hypothetical protein
MFSTAPRTALFAFMAASVVGCSSKPAPAPAPTASACPELPLDQTRRLYDFAPVSASNPVVATIDGCADQIPLSELRGHLAAEVTEDKRASLDHEERKRQLDRLIDEHLFLMDAYRQKADQTNRAVETLTRTRKMLLGEFLTAREVDAKAKTADDHARLKKELLKRVLGKAHVTVSNEGYATLKTAAKKASAAKDPADVLASMAPDVREQLVVAFQDIKLTVGDVLPVYLKLPVKERPDIERPDGMVELVKHLLEEDFLAAEALSQGIDRERGYLEKVELNRNALARMWSQDQSAAHARERLAASDVDARLHEWYKDHLATRYTYKENGKEKVMPFDQNRDSILNDYSDALRDSVRAEEGKALRQGHKIVVDEAVMDQG